MKVESFNVDAAVIPSVAIVVSSKVFIFIITCILNSANIRAVPSRAIKISSHFSRNVHVVHFRCSSGKSLR